MKRTVETKDAPPALGPYSQGVLNDGRLIFTAGQLGIDPETGELVEGGITAQTERALLNLQAVLEAGFSTMRHAVKVTVFLADMNDFAAVNEVYGKYFIEELPARSAFQVAALPKGALVEIECIAATR